MSSWDSWNKRNYFISYAYNFCIPNCQRPMFLCTSVSGLSTCPRIEIFEPTLKSKLRNSMTNICWKAFRRYAEILTIFVSLNSNFVYCSSAPWLVHEWLVSCSIAAFRHRNITWNPIYQSQRSASCIHLGHITGSLNYPSFSLSHRWCGQVHLIQLHERLTTGR